MAGEVADSGVVDSEVVADSAVEDSEEVDLVVEADSAEGDSEAEAMCQWHDHRSYEKDCTYE